MLDVKSSFGWPESYREIAERYFLALGVSIVLPGAFAFVSPMWAVVVFIGPLQLVSESLQLEQTWPVAFFAGAGLRLLSIVPAILIKRKEMNIVLHALISVVFAGFFFVWFTYVVWSQA